MNVFIQHTEDDDGDIRETRDDWGPTRRVKILRALSNTFQAALSLSYDR